MAAMFVATRSIGGMVEKAEGVARDGHRCCCLLSSRSDETANNSTCMERTTKTDERLCFQLVRFLGRDRNFGNSEREEAS